jgi:hypothetical protein
MKNGPKADDSAEAVERRKEELQMERTIIDEKFPLHAASQPGFEEAARAIAAEGAKNPKAPAPFYALSIYILDQADARFLAKMKQMEDSTYHLPR